MKLHIFSLLIIANVCQLSYASQVPFLRETKRVSLPQSLKETSGLHCEASDFVSINDSGNEPIVFRLSERGEVVHQYKLTSDNRDWEAITGDSNFWYVGDIGNNTGRRKHLSILKVSKTNPNDITELVFRYEGIEPSTLAYLSHDFDAEALVHVKEHLVLFSKSWNTEITKVYLLDKASINQLLKPKATINGLPGVVTGATWDNQRQEYIVVGYSLPVFGTMQPFIASLGESFNVLQIQTLENLSQVEAVCVTSDNRVWLTQEGGVFQSPLLIEMHRL